MMTANELIREAKISNSKYLNLSNLGLNEFPKEIFEIKDLETLKLMSNKIKIIPQDIKQLTNLKHLYLYSNCISEISEDLLLDMPYLENFDLAENPIDYHETILFYHKNNRMIGYRENLETIKNYNSYPLTKNSLSLYKKSKILPEELFALTDINSLSIHLNELEVLPNLISNLINLEYLDLANNKLDNLPKDFYKLSKLKYLNLNNNKFQNIPDIVWSLPNLETLYFDNNEIKNFDFSIFTKKQLIDFSALNNPFENFNSQDFLYYTFFDLKSKYDYYFEAYEPSGFEKINATIDPETAFDVTFNQNLSGGLSMNDLDDDDKFPF